MDDDDSGGEFEVVEFEDGHATMTVKCTHTDSACECAVGYVEKKFQISYDPCSLHTS